MAKVEVTDLDQLRIGSTVRIYIKSEPHLYVTRTSGAVFTFDEILAQT